MNLQAAYKIYTNLKEDNLCFGYRGKVTDDMTEKIVALSEYSANNLEQAKKLRKRVSFLMAESFQNIVRHANVPDENNGSTHKIGMFLARSMANRYYIVSSNLVNNSCVDSIHSKLARINNLSVDELKLLYMEILSQSELSEKGGAGLGFIEMARKSGHKLDFDFEKINDQFSLFYLGVNLRTNNNQPANTERASLSLSFAKDFHNSVNEGNILMLYKGDFSRESIFPLIEVIEQNMDRNMEGVRVKKQVFLVLIELLQNVSKHALKIKGIRDGIFIIGKKDNFYQITVGNFTENQSVNSLEERIKDINTFDNEGLAKLYKTTLMEGQISNTGGAGVGIIDIARGSSGKMNYLFIPHEGESITFFLLTVTI